MAGVEQMDFGIGEVAPVGFRPGRAEDLIMASPRDECRGLMNPEVLLKGRIGVEIELVIPEQLELDGVVGNAWGFTTVEEHDRTAGLLGSLSGPGGMAPLATR
jgi:hypothetical protein